MAVSKRTRFEVLRRDNHTCRYCGGSAPDVVLTVDHVTPVALGGSDDPSNLVAACKDCNAGKASTSPDAATVADVKQVDIQWAGAIKRVAAARARAHKKRNRYRDAFLAEWDSWSYGGGRYKFDLPSGWESSVAKFYDLGVPIEELIECARVALGNTRIRYGDQFRYFCGCVWRIVTDMQESAKALLSEPTPAGSDDRPERLRQLFLLGWWRGYHNHRYAQMRLEGLSAVVDGIQYSPPTTGDPHGVVWVVDPGTEADRYVAEAL